MDSFSRSALHIAANLVVSSWVYLLSIHRLPPRRVSRVMGNKLARYMLEAITIGLRKLKEKNSNKVQV